VDFPGDGGASPSDGGPPVVDMGCVPMDKMAACGGATCGSAPNGCGGIISCGTCGGSMVCCGDTCMPGKLCL
jgi:hypothetical protein